MKFAALALALAAGFISAAPAAATERDLLDWGRFFTNDVLGDGYDRWRTGAYTVSIAYGPSNHLDELTDRWGEMLEFRIRSEIIAPASLQSPSASDRPFAGTVSFGVHSHSMLGQAQLRTGFDLVFVGPQTGMGEFQNALHTTLGLTETKILDDQLSDAVYPTLSGELSRDFTIGRARLRPFAEVQAGVESFARIGADLTLGSFGQGALLTRDATTGHLYQVIRSRSDRGFSFVLGGDIARVWSSEFLPEDMGYAVKDTRSRLRAGVNYQGDRYGAYYGLTWLTEEFEAQPEGQLVGALQLRLFF